MRQGSLRIYPVDLTPRRPPNLHGQLLLRRTLVRLTDSLRQQATEASVLLPPFAKLRKVTPPGGACVTGLSVLVWYERKTVSKSLNSTTTSMRSVLSLLVSCDVEQVPL